jgi:hypothetical protein
VIGKASTESSRLTPPAIRERLRAAADDDGRDEEFDLVDEARLLP